MTELRMDALSPMELLAAMERGHKLTCELLRAPRSNRNRPEHWTRYELDGHAIPHAPARCLLWAGDIRVTAMAEGLVVYGVSQCQS